ncbi:hypothetical protein JW935_06085 [candidate division KSB1 bacterium]|nr:hypothetical protein [candidate division KSB1 bacterium]
MKTTVCVILLSFTLILAQSVNVPLNYWGYRFIDRLETKNLFESNNTNVRPLTRRQFTAILAQVRQKVAQNPSLFSHADLRLFEQLVGDFADELEISANLPTEKHALAWKETDKVLYLDLYAGETVISNKGDQYDPDELLSETTMGGILRGHLGHTIGYYMDARNTLMRGQNVKKENFDVSQGSPVVTSGANIYQDRALAYFTIEKPWLFVQAGLDEANWGPGVHNGLTLTRNAPPFYSLRLRTHFKRLAFNSLFGQLNSSLGAKFIAGHRLDLKLVDGLYLGASETVIFGNRNVEMAYLNPIMPYHIAEHHLGDKDNNNISFDIKINFFPNVKLFAEYYIDDMTSSASLTSYFGNKFAFVTGGTLADPFKIRNLDVRFEYARIEPYVYTHWDSINIYTHYDKIIGHWLGPNSQDVYLQTGYQMGRDLRLEFTMEKIRKGIGKADTKTRPSSGTGKKFLDGMVEKKNLYGIRIVNQFRRDIFASICYYYADIKNLNLTTNQSCDHLARFELVINY